MKAELDLNNAPTLKAVGGTTIDAIVRAWLCRKEIRVKGLKSAAVNTLKNLK